MIKWLIRLAWIFGILGVAGTIAIVVLMLRNPDSTTPKDKESKNTSSPAPVKSDTIADQKKQPPVTMPVEQPPVQQKDTLPDSVIKEPVEPIKEKIQTPAKDTPIIKHDTFPSAKTEKKIKSTSSVTQKKVPAEKRLTKIELKQLLTRINKASVKYNLYSHCVQMHRTVGTNNKLASSQVEQYLRNNGYTIAGREALDAAVQGIKVGTTGQCIRLTIGSFK